jgi:aryl-alcohol dehydrogenase-like predicted oxidoreductase
MTFGNEANKEVSFRLMDQAFDAGINFFDTADIYNDGDSERIVGEWMNTRRDELILASKVHFPAGEKGINDKGNSRRHIIQGVDQCLSRLKSDYMDILYLHHWDENTDIRYTLQALTDVVQQGKVHYVGLSNFSAWQCSLLAETARSEGFAPISVIQPMYSLIKRVVEIEILPMASYHRLGVCVYSPMGSGMLTGKYHRNEAGRINKNTMYKERYKNPEYMETAGKFVEYADSKGLDPAALSVSWANSHPDVTCAIIGGWKEDHLTRALKSREIELNPEDRDLITNLSQTVPNATDREDMAHLKITSPGDNE